MKDIHYDFIDLDTDESFYLLGKSLGGVLRDKSLQFNNYIAQGELIKSAPDDGLWIRKWKFTVFQKIILHKTPPPPTEEKKFLLIYFLNPTIFDIKNKRKKININSNRNSLFLTSDVKIDFSVIPKQPFYVLDIAFTASWLLRNFADADSSFIQLVQSYINNNVETILSEPCSTDEYRILNELEDSMAADKEDVLFLRSRVYNLIVNLFSKVLNKKQTATKQSNVSYEQLVVAEKMITQNIKTPPKIEEIARTVGMSVSSLLRHFKSLYGKSIGEYYLEKKMELAKRMILKDCLNVKEVAEIIGYNQPSPFIECFTKYHGYSPGSLKQLAY